MSADVVGPTFFGCQSNVRTNVNIQMTDEEEMYVSWCCSH